MRHQNMSQPKKSLRLQMRITTHDSNSYTNDVTFQANFTSPNIHTNENSHTSKNDTELFVSLENKQLTY